MIKLVSLFSANVDGLRDHFEETLSGNDQGLDVQLYESKAADFYDGKPFLPEWYDFLRDKCRVICAALNESEEGDIVIFSDIDVEFYRPFAEEIERLFADNPKVEIFMQMERAGGIEYNTGFVCMRNCEAVRGLWEVAEDSVSGNILGDQDFINKNIERFGVRHAFLPPTFTTRTYCAGISPAVRGAFLLHCNGHESNERGGHSIECSYVAAKLSRMEKFKADYLKTFGVSVD